MKATSLTYNTATESESMDKSHENKYVMALTTTASISAIMYLIFDRMIGGMLGLEGWPVIVADIFLVIFTICLLIGAISSIKALVQSKGKDAGA